MALEDLTGADKFIGDLVATNPTVGTDKKFEGDDHLRGIKNVLKNSFPNITGVVTATQAELNLVDGINTSAKLMAGDGGTTKALFYNATAPTGWTIDLTVDDRMLIVDKDNGATTGGTGSATSIVVTGTNATEAAHTHNVLAPVGSSADVAGGTTEVSRTTHTHTTDAGSAHTHAFTADAYAPLYAAVIVATLDA